MTFNFSRQCFSAVLLLATLSGAVGDLNLQCVVRPQNGTNELCNYNVEESPKASAIYIKYKNDLSFNCNDDVPVYWTIKYDKNPTTEKNYSVKITTKNYPGDYSSVLTITKVSLLDNGYYQCGPLSKALESNKNNTKKLYLSVYNVQIWPDPHIDKLEMQYNNDFTFNCTGDEPVVWTKRRKKNDASLALAKDPSVNIMGYNFSSYYSSVLTLTKFTAHDTGYYDCNTMSAELASDSTFKASKYVFVIDDRLCIDWFTNIGAVYTKKYHSYVSLLVCVLGSLGNAFIIIVLLCEETRSPTVTILIALAVADLLYLMTNVLYGHYVYKLPQDFMTSYKDNIMPHILIVFNPSMALHTVTAYLTVTLTVWRYVAVVRPLSSRIWCRMKTTLQVITLIYVLCPLICIPYYLTLARFPVDEAILFIATLTDMTDGDGGILREYALYSLYSRDRDRNRKLVEIGTTLVVTRIVPCLTQTALTLRLTCVLKKAAERRRVEPTEPDGARARTNTERRTNRTSRILLAILVVDLLNEIPQAVSFLLSLWFGGMDNIQCHLATKKLYAILELVNSAVPFVVYFTMCQQFRNTFMRLFLSSWKFLKSRAARCTVVGTCLRPRPERPTTTEVEQG